MPNIKKTVKIFTRPPSWYNGFNPVATLNAPSAFCGGDKLASNATYIGFSINCNV